MTATSLTDLETAILEKLLDGQHPVLRALRQQLPRLTVASRELTGVGFYTTFDVLVRSDALPDKLMLGDVEASLEGTRHGAGFVLYVNSGALTMLEGYTYDEPWPLEVRAFSLRYQEAERSETLAMLSQLSTL